MDWMSLLLLRKLVSGSWWPCDHFWPFIMKDKVENNTDRRSWTQKAVMTAELQCVRLRSLPPDKILLFHYPAIAHSQACWLVILTLLVTILLHFLGCSHAVSIWDGVKLWLIAPGLCLLGVNHAAAVGMLPRPEGGRSRVDGATMGSGGGEVILCSSCVFPRRQARSLTAQLWSQGSLLG